MKIPVIKFKFNKEIFTGKKKRISITLGLLFIIILSLFIFTGKSSKNLTTYTVKKGEFVISVTESGELKAASNFTVTSPRSWGKLQIISLVPEGTIVKEGDLLVKFDPSELQKKLSDKENELSITESDIKKTKADQLANKARLDADIDNARIAYELAKLNVEKMKFESESRQKEAQLNLEQSKNNYDGSKQKIESQKIIDQSDLNRLYTKLNQIKAEIDLAKKDVEQLSVKAILPGLVVYEYNWNTGKKIAIGDNPWPGMALISLPDLSKIQILTSVNEVDVSKVGTGQFVKIKLDAFPDKDFTGKVSSVSTIGKNKEQSSGIKVFEVIIDVDGTDPIFKPGMTTSNEIVTEVIPDAIFVPLESVFEKDGKTIVYKVASSPAPHEIKLGKKNADYVIVEEGLNPGDVVTLTDPTIESTDEMKPAPAPRKKPMKSSNEGSGNSIIIVR
jgi:HlyD family secretion protein